MATTPPPERTAEAKARLRRRIRAASAKLAPARRAAGARALVEPVLAAVTGADVVAGYRALPHELDPGPALAACQARGQALALPRCEGPGLMRLLRWVPGMPLTPDAAGVPAPPAEAAEVRLDAAVAVLVPGLAFDAADQVRLGMGGGYYDRLLAATEALTLGIAFPHQVVVGLPRDPWDLAVDRVLVAGPAPASAPAGP